MVYVFDSRVHPQIPYAVFPLHAPFWLLCGLASTYITADGSKKTSVSIITVEPNEVLKSVGHHRTPVILRTPDEAKQWLHTPKQDAVQLLRPIPEENMGVEPAAMGIKLVMRKSHYQGVWNTVPENGCRLVYRINKPG